VTAASFACTALLCWQLNVAGGLPREAPIDRVRAHATAQQQVRVLIIDNADTVTLRLNAAVAVESAQTGERLATAVAGARLTLRPSGTRVAAQGPGLNVRGDRLLIRPLTSDGGTVISSRGGWGRRGVYSGALDVARVPGGIRVVERVDLEPYVAGVLAAEMPPDFPLEAMKAQAVAARTYTLQHLGDHADDDADLCARVHCQAYAGMPSSRSVAADAARQTAGRVLSWNGMLVDALYHSACGGATAAAWDVRQGKLLPYLRGAPDTPGYSQFEEPYCGRDHQLAWTKHFSLREAQRLISSNLPRVLGQPGLSPGKLESLSVVKSPRGQRAAWLEVATSTGVYRVRGDAIRWVFGTGYAGPVGLRSTAFDLTTEYDASGEPRAFLFEGVGHGHGLGLCQWGARGRALAGQTAGQILAAYYPGAAVTDLRR
jgi:stage II sporulation protein D